MTRDEHGSVAIMAEDETYSGLGDLSDSRRRGEQGSREDVANMATTPPSGGVGGGGGGRRIGPWKPTVPSGKVGFI